MSLLVVVDDEPAHIALIERTLKRSGFNKQIITFCDGRQIIEWLETEYLAHMTTTAPFIFLDINMPYKTGIEVLETIKQNPVTAHIPVIMLSTSDNQYEINKCYRLGCNAFITKPVIHDEFKHKIRQLGAFLTVMGAPNSFIDMADFS